jgi:hypothetical protein
MRLMAVRQHKDLPREELKKKKKIQNSHHPKAIPRGPCSSF